MKEILLKVDNNILSVKAFGIYQNNNKILLRRGKNNSYSFPGGAIAFNETAEQGLIRKLSEEIDQYILVNNLAFISEEFSESNKQRNHEICFYYRVTILNKNILTSDTVKNLQSGADDFVFVEKSKISKLNIKPKNAAEIIDRIKSKSVHHIVIQNT